MMNMQDELLELEDCLRRCERHATATEAIDDLLNAPNCVGVRLSRLLEDAALNGRWVEAASFTYAQIRRPNGAVQRDRKSVV